MHYSDKPNSVRVDFFKKSGKWYTTEAIELPPNFYHEPTLHENFIKVLVEHLEGRLKGMTAVCLEIYHKHNHPIMVTVPE